MLTTEWVNGITIDKVRGGGGVLYGCMRDSHHGSQMYEAILPAFCNTTMAASTHLVLNASVAIQQSVMF